MSLPPSSIYSQWGLTVGKQLQIVWNGALIGFSYFHTREYKYARKGLHAVALFDSLFFSSSIPFLAQWDFLFHATSRSLSPYLLCSTWKETGYRSFGFLLLQIPSRSIHSVIVTSNPLHTREKLLLHLEHHGAVRHLLQLPGGPYNLCHRPSLTDRHIDKWTVEGQVSKARAQERGGCCHENKHWSPLGHEPALV